MGLDWIKVSATLPEHRKSQDLAEETGDPRAWTYMVQLWLWCAKNAPTGEIQGKNVKRILERAAGWGGEHGKFATAAINAGFVEAMSEDKLLIHNWDKEQAAHIIRAAKDAERHRVAYAKMKEELKILRRESKEKEKREVGGSEEPSLSPSLSSIKQIEGVQGEKEEKPPKPPREPSGQEEFYSWAQLERSVALPDSLPDKALTIKGINTLLKEPVKKAGILRLKPAYKLFLADERQRRMSPPCPMWFFAQDWSQWVGRVESTGPPRAESAPVIPIQPKPRKLGFVENEL